MDRLEPGGRLLEGGVGDNRQPRRASEEVAVGSCRDSTHRGSVLAWHRNVSLSLTYLGSEPTSLLR